MKAATFIRQNPIVTVWILRSSFDSVTSLQDQTICIHKDCVCQQFQESKI